MGKSLIGDLCQQTELAQLNLKAGQKARSATAYSAAFEYFSTGIDLLAIERWQTQYDLTLALYETATEAAYLSGNFSEMTKLATTVLERANTLLDRVKVYQVQIQAAQAQTQPAKAIQIALQILRELGISFPEQPNGEDIGQALQKTLGLVAGRSPLDLIALPEMTDATQLAIMAILAGVTASAYVAAPTLLPLIIAKQVELSLQYGNSSFAPDGYCGCGIILCGIVGDINYGYQFGQLALLLLEKLDDRNLKARTYGQVNCCISHWKDSLSSTLLLFREGYEIGLETGDLEWGGICAVLYLMHAWFAGKELNDLSREGAAFCSQLAQLKQGTMSKQGGIFQQAIWNLLGNETEAWQLTGDIFNQDKDLPVLLESGNQTAPCYFYVSKLLLSYLFGQIEEAIAASSALENYLGGATGMSLIPVFHTYDSLTNLGNYCQVSEPEQKQILARVTANQEKLKNWAEASPVNQLHKFHLVEAEQYRVLGNRLEAMENYDLAISLAQENKYLNEEAIANELAAKFYLNWGKEKVAAGYMQEAYYCYARWGAKAKTDDLEQRYPQLLQPILQQQKLSFNPLETIGGITSNATKSSTHTSSSNSISDALDFASALKAAQLISRNIQLDELTASLTKIILENAGAKKCALILPNENEWQVQAITTLIPHENLTTTTIPCQPLDDSQDVPVKLIQYVKRKLEPLVIDNCQTEISGVIGNYMQQHQPQSALCLPILNQGHLVGVIYLENRLTQGVFNSDRLEVINFLCTQAGISLENARLYQQAQQALHNLQQAQLQIVQSEKMSALGNLVAGVAHEINNPVGFIGGNIDPALDYIKDVFGLIDLYQQEYPEPKAIIQDEIETIDLEYIQSDLPKLINSMKLGINRITEISTSLRTFSRADQDYKVPCHLHEGIDSTILILKHRLKANDSRPTIIVVTEYGDLPPIECFPGQLNQVFMNLLANAIDALEESNQHRSYQEIEANPNQITIKTFLADGQVKISIADNGKGMTADVKERIFDHLFTTKGVGKGTGLGLAIARQIIVEKHGGAIAVNSTPGEGTEFILSFSV